ncbi:Carboxypeptidase E [Fasciola hepatica]|uniref:Carboxypeptidase E n=1 Tax=Fasciola hepatica TaxID=6192 RepID=A0A4E0S0K4_FASHE|nr:Carboxypeptidase E [Fasciola hepatica]
MGQVILFLALLHLVSANWDKQHTNGEISNLLNDINKECPDISHVYLLDDGGDKYTAGGNNLTVIVFAKYPFDEVPGVPEFKYVANMHGNEAVGRELLLRLAYDMCKGWRNMDPKISRLVGTTRIHLLPTMNPDGWEKAYKSDEKMREDIGRLNKNRTDLNRDFPDLDQEVFNHAFDKGPTDHLYSYTTEKNKGRFQKETRMIMQWLDQYNFVLSANIHGGDLVVNYPYDNSPSGRAVPSKTPDHNIFLELAHSYAEFNPLMREGINASPDFDKDFKHGTVNGADWYPITGSMQDYNYLATNAFELTLEVGIPKFPPAEELEKYWDQNREALYNFMAQVHRGIKGSIHGFDGQKLTVLANAVVSVTNTTDPNNAIPITHNIWSGSNGYYYRLLNRGRYTVTFKAFGYVPAIVCVTIDHVPEWTSSLQEAKILNAVLFKEEIKPSPQLMSQVNFKDTVNSYGDTRCGDLSSRIDAQQRALEVY